jgi:hypothetical protein
MTDRTRSTPVALLAAAAATLAATTALAVDAPGTCAAKKLRLSGAYAACRLRAEATAQQRGAAADVTACADRFAARLARIAARFPPGVCPTEDDGAAITTTVAEYTDELAGYLAGTPACPPGYETRTPDVVVADTLDAIAARDTARLACNYHEEAYLIDDQGILLGPAEIIAQLYSLEDLMAGGTVAIRDDTAFQDTVRLAFSWDAGWIVIEDGTATYVVRRGRIRQQTWHGLITFTGPPPE